MTSKISFLDYLQYKSSKKMYLLIACSQHWILCFIYLWHSWGIQIPIRPTNAQLAWADSSEFHICAELLLLFLSQSVLDGCHVSFPLLFMLSTALLFTKRVQMKWWIYTMQLCRKCVNRQWQTTLYSQMLATSCTSTPNLARQMRWQS